MSTGTSVVGRWQNYPDWGCTGNPVPASVFVFNADGTWSRSFGGTGRWIQVEGMVALRFDDVPTLVYSAAVTIDAMVGLMGYPAPPPHPGTGCFYMLREGNLQLARGPEKPQFDTDAGPAPDRGR